MLRREEFDVLDELRKTGALPRPLEERYQKLRRQQFFRAGLKCERYLPSSPSRLNPDMSVADWVRAKWTTTDEAVRHSLRLLADALGIPLPLRRSRPVPAQGSSPARRTRRDQQPNQHGDPTLSEIPLQFRYDDPPASDDDGWTPCESLRDAFRSDDDRGWY